MGKRVWLGVMDESNETIIGTSQGVVKCRDIKRLSDVEDRWNAERVLEVQGTPWQTIPGRKGVQIPVKVPMAEESTAAPPPVEEGEPAVRIKRRSKLQRQDVIQAGLTPGCPGCTAISRNAESQNHTEECRKKVEEWLINKGGSKAKLIQEGRKRVRWADQQEQEEQQQQQSEETERPAKASKAEEHIRTKRTREGESIIEEDRAHKYRTIDQEAQQEEQERDEMIDCIAAVDSKGAYWDELSGRELKPQMVRNARREEMGEVYKHNVYTKVPISESWNVTGKGPIGSRWIDINKGDDEKPDYRSRLVAQEINDKKREDLFAATPPLEAKKLLFSMAMTAGVGYELGHRHNGHKLEFIDVRRAYLHAKARRIV